jgi:hypothetical protein
VSTNPIDQYLRKLHYRWWWRRDRDRRLAEIEDHLKSAAEDLQVGGRSSHDAARAAVARYHTHTALWPHDRMGRCAALRPHQALTVNRAIVVSYRVGDQMGRQEVAAPAARIILTRGPTLQACARPQGATRLIASDITCTLAERTAASCHRLPNGTGGWCTTASRKWDCTFTSASRAFERCWLPSKRQWISVRWD